MYMIWIWGTEKESLYYFPKHIATSIQFLSWDHTINSIIKKHLHTFSISSINIMNLPESLKLKRRSFVLFLTCQNIDSKSFRNAWIFN